VRVFARRGAGAAAIHEIAAEAGVANGTFYNYFRTREELVDEASRRLATRFHEAIAASRARVADPAERLAVGTRRFVLQARHDPVWGAAIVRVWGGSAVLNGHTAAALLDDLRAGRRRGRLRFASEQAAVDLVQGAVLAGMRSVLDGRAGDEHATAVTTLVLRALGVGAGEAADIARRPLPPARLEAATPPAPRPGRSDTVSARAASPPRRRARRDSRRRRSRPRTARS
jgi:AcrR family transcriptional regulator